MKKLRKIIEKTNNNLLQFNGVFLFCGIKNPEVHLENTSKF